MHFCSSSRLLASGGSLSLFFRQRVLRQEEQSYMFEMVLIYRTHIPRVTIPAGHNAMRTWNRREWGRNQALFPMIEQLTPDLTLF